MPDNNAKTNKLTGFFFLAMILLLGMAALVFGFVNEAKQSASQDRPDIAGNVQATPVYLTEEGEKRWENGMPPVDENEVAITNPPVEKVGEHAGVEARLATADHAEMPAEACLLLVEELDEETQLKRKPKLEPVDFEVRLDDIVNESAIMFVQKLPGSSLMLQVPDEISGDFQIVATRGEVEEVGELKWEYTVPEETGIECIEIRREGEEAFMCIRVAVMEHYENDGELDGYKIGKYQKKPFKGNPAYLPPKGMVKVTAENAETWVSPHFRLGQFVCKQDGEYPKFMRLETTLLVKLELIVEFLKEKGQEVESLYITSGFRTPFYNKKLGNETNYSRHLYGDAADLFVDNNQDGKMDDLDRSGEVTGNDAKVLQNIVEDITTRYRYLRGGLGFYDVTNYPTPFIHVDTRGYQARWSR